MNLLDLARSAVADLPDGNASSTPIRIVSPSINAELKRLIAIILAADSEADRAEAMAVALADPDAALICFRTLAGEVTQRQADYRRTCGRCAELSSRGECRAVARGESIGIATARPYHPIPDLPLRCIGYQPKAEDSDRRTGRERWFGEEASDGR